MKLFKTLALVLGVGLLTTSCQLDKLSNLDFEDIPVGAYVRTFSASVNGVDLGKIATLSPGGTVIASGGVVADFNAPRIRLSELNTFTYTPILDAKDEQNGQLVQSYDLVIRFVDNTPANGTNSTQNVAFRSIPASAFAPSPVTGFARHTMQVTSQQVLQATRVDPTTVSAGDSFIITGTLKLSNGKSFNDQNRGANLTGDFYRSPFTYTIRVISNTATRPY